MNTLMSRSEGSSELMPVVVMATPKGMILMSAYKQHFPMWFWVIPNDEMKNVCDEQESSTILGWEDDEENDMEYYGDEADDDDDDLDDYDDDFDDDDDIDDADDVDDDLDDDFEEGDDFLDDDDDLDDDFVDLDAEDED